VLATRLRHCLTWIISQGLEFRYWLQVTVQPLGISRSMS
jgi:hypothetical protein